VRGEEGYYYINKNNLDASGRAQPIQEEKKISMHEITFECQIVAGTNTVAASVPAPVSAPEVKAEKTDKAKAKEAGK
jgi:hypothetical protein